MAKKFRMKTADQDGTDEEIVDLEFTDEEWEILEDFAKYAAEMENNSLIKEGIPSALHVNWTLGEGLTVETKLPTDEQIDAMLMKLRPFLLENEQTNFNDVWNIISKATPNQRVRKHLKALRFLYSGGRLQSLFVAGASSNDVPEGKIINSEEMLHLWLNGCRFHKNKDKQKIIDAMHGIMPPESSIALFLFLITDKVGAILALKRMISLFTGESEQIFAEMLLEEPMHYIAYLHPTISMLSFCDHEEEQERTFPPQGLWERVFDLTSLGGPATVPVFTDFVGRLWMNHELREEVGTWYYFFRLGKGFRTPDGKVSEIGMDIIVTLKVQVFLTEDPFYRDRRKPAQAVLERMRRDRQGITSTRVTLKSFEKKKDLDSFLDRDPKPEVEWHIVPRVAFQFAYWPISKQANERFHQIYLEDREPTFEEVEGNDISRAWEIFEDENDNKEEK
ncbi:MAG TPA: hypothetical protein VH394_28980 [Thermoanaerobaculia bacterium]|jgi:hypothetical protein|nr:hypothetical protein [Thermoanaerobaculia bacterium]